MTDERIAHILSEASQLMRVHNPDDLRSNEDSRSPADNRGEVSTDANPLPHPAPTPTPHCSSSASFIEFVEA